jgi:hypothetical protein
MWCWCGWTRSVRRSPRDRFASVVWADLLSQAGQNARPFARYLVFMVAAGIIAAFGVIYANVTLVVGAMAISPDTLPIAAAATALVLSGPFRKYGGTESGHRWMPGADAECGHRRRSRWWHWRCMSIRGQPDDSGAALARQDAERAAARAGSAGGRSNVVVFAKWATKLSAAGSERDSTSSRPGSWGQSKCYATGTGECSAPGSTCSAGSARPGRPCARSASTCRSRWSRWAT